MLKLISALALIAGTLVLAVVATMPGTPSTGLPAAGAATPLGPGVAATPIFAAGVLAGLALGWVWSLPWGEIPAMIAAWLGRMTRRARLIGLGVLFVCVILYF